jgi:methionyl-tRNA synthetase
MDAVRLRLGIQTVMAISALGNNYLQSSGLGNALMADNPKRCAQVLSRALNLIYVLSTLIYPFMPATSESILKQINAPPRAVPLNLSTDLLAGHQIGKPEHLFKKIEESMAEVYRKKFGGEAEAGGAAAADATEGMSKRKAAAAKKAAAKAAAASTGPKSPEVEAAEALVAEQGQLVRSLKAQTPATPELETEITKAVAELKLRKDALLALQMKEAELANAAA